MLFAGEGSLFYRMFKTLIKCKNLPGEYECECDIGFEAVGDACVNINECTIQDTCDHDHVCVDNDGGFTCLCHDGFLEATSLCDDIDECAAGDHGCYDWAHRYEL